MVEELLKQTTKRNKTSPLIFVRYLFLLLVIFMLGCDENKPTAETYDNLILKSDQTVTLKGKASMEPYIKENQSALIFDGKPIFFQGDFKSINEDINGQSITVTGKLIKKRWPMFIYDPSTHKGPVPQGMPMPPGTDIEKESLYFVIESPHWKVN